MRGIKALFKIVGMLAMFVIAALVFGVGLDQVDQFHRFIAGILFLISLVLVLSGFRLGLSR